MSDKEKTDKGIASEERQAELMDETLDSYSVEEEPEGKETPPAKKDEGEETPPVEPKEGDDEEEEATAEEELEGILSGSDEEDEEPAGEEEEEEPETPPTGDKEKEEEQPEEAEVTLDLSNDEFEDVTSSPEALAKYASKIYDKAEKTFDKKLEKAEKKFEQALEKRAEEIMKGIPEVVSKSAERAQSTADLTKNFYSNYPELKERRGYVKRMVNSVSTQNPGWSAKQVLDEVGQLAEQDFQLAKEAKETEKKRNDPKFAGAGGRRSPSGNEDNRSKQQKLLDQTFSS